MAGFDLGLDALNLEESAGKLSHTKESYANKPICVLVIGMAGSGKSSLMQRINLEMIEKNKRAYYINLDPATTSANDLPFAANIDIRDTVKYKEVMKQYGLGPNGAILTSLNLFATKFDQVVTLIESRVTESMNANAEGASSSSASASSTSTSTSTSTSSEKGKPLDYVFIDTPGQIEVFTWSAGGQIIHELLATAFPTVVLYVVDTPRCVSPTTFMSNMLYACSVLYKSQLPLICAFNKTDVVGCEFALEWMTDFESFQEAVDADDSEEYMGPFNRSLSLVMDEFYNNIRSVGVSAVTGSGIDALLGKFHEASEEFMEVFLPELEKKRQEMESKNAKNQAATIRKIKEDIKMSGGDKPLKR